MAETPWRHVSTGVRRSRKRFAALARIRSAPRIMAVAAALVVAHATVLPAHALEVASNTSTCTGTMTLTFFTPLTIMPAARAFSVSGSGSCTGLSSGPATWSSLSISSIDATCEGIVAQGNGSLSVPGAARTVAMIAVGPAPLESWTFMDNTGANSLQASGAFAWTNTAEIQNCLGSGTSTVTLTGSFAVVA